MNPASTQIHEPSARAQLSEFHILDRFNEARYRLGYDTSYARRSHEVRWRLNLLLEQGVYWDREAASMPQVSLAEYRAAFDRIAPPRIARIDREDYRSWTKYSVRTLATWQLLARAVGSDHAIGARPDYLPAARTTLISDEFVGFFAPAPLTK